MKDKLHRQLLLLVGCTVIAIALLIHSWVGRVGASPDSSLSVPNSHAPSKNPLDAVPLAAFSTSQIESRSTDVGSASVSELKRHLSAATTMEAKVSLGEALVRIGTPESFQAYLEAVVHEADSEMRAEMMRALEAATAKESDIIASLLAVTNDPIITGAVARSIARLATEDTVQFLGELYSEEEAVEGQRQNVLSALSYIRTPAAIPALTTMLNDTPSDELGAACALSLGKMGTADAINDLAAAFDTIPPEQFVKRHAVIQQLSAINNMGSVAYLESLAERSAQPLVKAAASEALANLQTIALGPKGQSPNLPQAN